MHLTLHLTNRCNLACSYCYSSHTDEDMTLDTAIQAITQCAEGANCGIIFFGGEPLLRQDLIWEVIRWCEQNRPNKFHYKVTTNGTLLDAAFLDKATRWNLHIALSHDGVQAAHDRCRTFREGGGTFDTLLPRLEMLLERRPYSPIMMTVNPETVDQFTESVEWLQSKGAQYLICSLNYAGNWTDASLRKLKQEYLKLEKWHRTNYVEERKMYFSPFDKRVATRVFNDRGTSCRLGKRQISIGPDGRLYPCVQFVGHDGYAIGDVETGMNEKRREEIFSINEQDKPACEGCGLAGRCHNKCGCLNFQNTGSLRAIPPLLCEHERMVFPIADRLAERLFKDRVPMFVQRHYNPAFPVLSFLEDLHMP
ncbi:MAG: radical SAM protein [Lentisphaerota bacterium]